MELEDASVSQSNLVSIIRLALISSAFIFVINASPFGICIRLLLRKLRVI